MRYGKRFWSLAAILSGALLAAPVAAQDAADGQAQQEAGQAFSDEKLDAFAEAATEVNKVMFAWRGRMQQAKNQQEQQEMLQQANEEIVTIVQDTANISMQEYQAIATAAGEDQSLADDLRARVRKKMQDEQGGGAQ